MPRWDFSAQGQARVALITVIGVVVSMAVACVAVSFTTPMMEEAPRQLTWAAAIAIPVFLSGPTFYLFARQLRELAIAHAQLLVVASQDNLTGCLNRGAFVTLVDAYLSQVTAAGRPVEGALLVIDADH